MSWTHFRGGARRVWRVWLCCSERFCGGPYRFGYSAAGGDGEHEQEEERTAGGTGVLLSRAGRQVRNFVANAT